MPISEKFQLGWLAGILEGEGYFGTNGKSRTPLIRLGMTDKDVIDRAAVILGQHKATTQALSSGKTFYIIFCNGATSRYWMKRLRPYMGERRQARIDKVLSEAAEPRRAHL